ncbi:MAG TPA: flavin reductase family protein [Solirubrobacteraceae bacterium]|nr:flavin reductase family protein [Solirubrobacteraceae bacterium]
MPAFDALMAVLDYPMLIVTARSGREVDGCLVGFAAQVSVHPPRFLVGLSRRNRTFRIAREATHLGVHLVAEDDAELAELFGGRSGDDTDKLARVAWHEGPAGVPLLDELPNRFAGRVLERLALGDHVGHLLEPIAAEYAGDEPPFTFRRARDIEPGHAP